MWPAVTPSIIHFIFIPLGLLQDSHFRGGLHFDKCISIAKSIVETEYVCLMYSGTVGCSSGGDPV